MIDIEIYSEYSLGAIHCRTWKGPANRPGESLSPPFLIGTFFCRFCFQICPYQCLLIFLHLHPLSSPPLLTPLYLSSPFDHSFSFPSSSPSSSFLCSLYPPPPPHSISPLLLPPTPSSTHPPSPLFLLYLLSFSSLLLPLPLLIHVLLSCSSSSTTSSPSSSPSPYKSWGWGGRTDCSMVVDLSKRSRIVAHGIEILNRY